MRILNIFLLVSLFVAGCISTSKTSNKDSLKSNTIVNKSLAAHPEMYMDKFDKGIDFIASGNEPFWSLKIDFEKYIHFKMADGFEINTPAVKGLKRINANTIRYQSNINNNPLVILLQKANCFNDMSGAELPYTVTITTKTNTDKNSTIFKGCGQYLADYRLHDIWLLDSINDKKVNVSDFINGIPRIEFNLTQRKFFAGTNCQTISGNMEVKGKKIYFGKFSSSNINCKQGKFEAGYLQKISNKIVPYQIKPGKLYLNISNSSVFIYKKID